MKLFLTFALMTFFSFSAFGSACLMQYPNNEKESCIEYRSNNPDIINAMKIGCEASRVGKWVEACPRAEFGCKNDFLGLYESILWFINGEDRETVEAACKVLNAEFVTI